MQYGNILQALKSFLISMYSLLKPCMHVYISWMYAIPYTQVYKNKLNCCKGVEAYQQFFTLQCNGNLTFCYYLAAPPITIGKGLVSHCCLSSNCWLDVLLFPWKHVGGFQAAVLRWGWAEPSWCSTLSCRALVGVSTLLSFCGGE